MTGVQTDMKLHTVTLTFDDAVVSLDDVISALADAGYVARQPVRLE